MLGTGLAVFDEGHELRHGQESAKGKAAARLCEVSRLRMMMTATPVFNYGDEIFNIMRFIRRLLSTRPWSFADFNNGCFVCAMRTEAATSTFSVMRADV